jgi:uncharacterized protein
MQINVAQLLKEGTGATRTHDLDEILTPDDASTQVDIQECRVAGRVSLTRAERGILLKGSFSCQTQLTCGRCLAFFPHSAAFSVEEMFYPSIDILTGLPQALPEEDTSSNFTIDEHHILDTSEMIRQYCLLAIPLKPLCRVDCAGLCPDCGANLNENKCQCVRGHRTALAVALEQAEALDRAQPLDRAKSQRKLG